MTDVATPLASPPGRVAAWDLLRGLCALAVCAFHLLYWLDLAQWHAWGAYGVYLFFVLSGASLAHTYANAFDAGRFSLPSFLIARLARLAPLYLLLLTVIPWQLPHEPGSSAFLWRVLANLSFTFGFYQPTQQALLVGGWSLGIEVVYYLAFPALLWLSASARTAWPATVAVLGLQVAWIAVTLGQDDYASGATAYHHPPAFLAYFWCGCLIGRWRLRQGEVIHHTSTPPWRRATTGALLMTSALAALALEGAPDPGAVLTGWRGVLLPLLCVALVAYASGLSAPGPQLDRLARRLADATYGLYLIHPVLFFWITLHLLPALQAPAAERWPLSYRLALGAAVLATTFGLALLSERVFERPLRLRLRQNWDRVATGRTTRRDGAPAGLGNTPPPLAQATGRGGKAGGN